MGEVERLFQLAGEFERSGNLPQLAATYGELLDRTGRPPALLAALGSVEQRLGQPDAAARHYGEALEQDPNLAMVWLNLGALQRLGGDLDQAARSLGRAIELAPSGAALVNLGLTHQDAGDLEAALQTLQRAVAIAPELPEAHYNLGNACAAAGRMAPAVAAYERAMQLRPDHFDARWNLSHALLRQGEYLRGFEAFEARWQIASLKAKAADFSQPLWNGENIAGKALLVWGEQGFGDVLQFARYAPMAASTGARVTLAVPPHMCALLATLDGVEQVVSLDAALPAFDWQCPVMSLPRVFGTTRESIPAQFPYLHADKALARDFEARLPQDGGLRVGLVWSSGIRRHDQELFRFGLEKSVPPRLFATLPRTNIVFVSLQVGASSVDLGLPLVDFSNELVDFAATAALIDRLDLVISVDTAVAHLAGALGKPVWLLLNTQACWRWALEREKSPWYPTFRLFRQAASGDWRGPIDAVRRGLAELAQSRRESQRRGWFGRWFDRPRDAGQ